MTALAATRVGAHRPDHTDSIRGEDWRESAACRDHDVELFFEPTGRRKGLNTDARVAAAKAICARCSVIQQCGEFAAHTRDQWAILAGQTPDERGTAYKRRGPITAACDRCGTRYKRRQPQQRYCTRDCRRAEERDKKRAARQQAKEETT